MKKLMFMLVAVSAALLLVQAACGPAAAPPPPPPAAPPPPPAFACTDAIAGVGIAPGEPVHDADMQAPTGPAAGPAAGYCSLVRPFPSVTVPSRTKEHGDPWG